MFTDNEEFISKVILDTNTQQNNKDHAQSDLFIESGGAAFKREGLSLNACRHLVEAPVSLFYSHAFYTL